MEFLDKYEIFLEKALLPSQFRKYTSEFNRERYEELFQRMKEKYDGDRKAYRIYLPLLTSKIKSLVEIDVKNFLGEKDYEIIDYIKGICKHITAKNPSKIGQILNRSDRQDLLKRFNEDPSRKVGENKLVCISRHPYDIAGADTDRNWTNCMTIGTKCSPRTKRDIAEYRKLNIELKKKDIEETEIGYQMEDLNKEGKRDEELQRKRLQISTEINAINTKMEQLARNMSNRERNGCNMQYLILDVKLGSLISYLIKDTDKNLTDPLAVMNIKPYIEVNERGERKNDGKNILRSDKNWYGEGSLEFKKTVDKFLDEVNQEFLGEKDVKMFYLTNNIYDDSSYGYFLLVKNPTFEELKTFYNKNRSSFGTTDLMSFLNANKNINKDERRKFLDYVYLEAGHLNTSDYLRYITSHNIKIDIKSFSSNKQEELIKQAFIRKNGKLFEMLRDTDSKITYCVGFSVRHNANFINEKSLDWFDKELHELGLVDYVDDNSEKNFKKALKAFGI